jgi:alkylhydroperoxidase family enzyme
MRDRHEGLLRSLIDAVAGPGGRLDATARRDLLAGKPLTGALGVFAARVTEDAGSITDEHVATLRSGGVDEESIFDCIVAAAIASGLVRLRAALRSMEEAP